MYCLRCKKHTENKNEEIVSNNRKSALCKVCNSKKSQFIKTQAGSNAKIANESYKDADKRAENVDGYIYDKELSDKKNAVYVNPETKELYIGHRGTKATDTQDLKDDLRIIAGRFTEKNSERLRHDKEVLNNVKGKYTDYKVTHSSHSLGGAVASQIADPEDKIINYNKGSSPLQNLKEKKNPNETNHHSVGDIISVSSLIGRNRVKVHLPKIISDITNPFGSHSLSNYIKKNKKKK